VQVVTRALGPGQLGVTLQAGQAPLTRLDIGAPSRALDNAVVDVIGGPSGITAGTSYTPPTGASVVELRVRRLDPTQPVMVPLAIVDGCGSWGTFVGGGSGAF
jgi:hypothetical protein